MVKIVLMITSLLFAQAAFAQQPVPAGEMSQAKTKEEVLKVKDTDIVIGDPDAPITFYEFASLSCSHCAAFQTHTLPKLKEEYIDKGKLNIVFRSFPLDETALRANMLAYCAGDKAEKFLDVMFSTQSNWAPKKNYLEILSNIAKLGGMSGQEFEACMQNREVENLVISNKFEGVKVLEIRSTPTFFIDGEKYEGARDYDFFSDVIEKKLSPKSEGPAQEVEGAEDE